MPNDHEPSSPLEHHYPPTTAEWVTSPLMREEEVEPNPLEPATRPPVKPGLRLAALLIIGSGLLSLCALIVEFFADNAASPSAWRSLGAITFGFLTLFVPIVFAVGGIVRGLLLSRSTTHRNLSQVSQFAIGGVVFQLVNFVPLPTRSCCADASGGSVVGLVAPQAQIRGERCAQSSSLTSEW